MNRLQLKRRVKQTVKRIKEHEIKNMKFDFNFRHDGYMQPVLRIFCNGVNVHYGVNNEHPAYVFELLNELESVRLNIQNYNKGEVVMYG